jgi:hypothetical protein
VPARCRCWNRVGVPTPQCMVVTKNPPLACACVRVCAKVCVILTYLCRSWLRACVSVRVCVCVCVCSRASHAQAYAMYVRLVTKRLPHLKYLDTLPVDGRVGPSGAERHLDARMSLIRRASDLLRGVGGGTTARRSSIGAQVIRKSLEAKPIAATSPPPVSRAGKEHMGFTTLRDDATATDSAIEVANRKREQLEISQAEYDHIAVMIEKIAQAENESSDAESSDAGDACADRDEELSLSGDFGALLEVLESRHDDKAQLTMREERTLAIALDKADAMLVEEMAELQLQARIIEIERNEKIHGLHDPSDHPVVAGGGGEDGAFVSTDGFSKSMSKDGFHHVDGNKRACRLRHSNLPPALDLATWSTTPTPTADVVGRIANAAPTTA